MPTPSQIWAKVVQLLANFQQHRHTGTDSPKVSYLNLTNIPTLSYAGSVISNAASVPFPTDWTLTHNSTGSYTITHNLGSAKYGVGVAILGAAAFAAINNKGSTSFDIDTYNSSASATDENFEFVVSFNNPI